MKSLYAENKAKQIIYDKTEGAACTVKKLIYVL
jgi:uncharacterized protein (UPF0333 family)